MTGAHVHLVHLSTKRGYDLVDAYRAMGHRASAELCAHYLHFDAEQDIGRLGALMKVNPPIRHGAREDLWLAYDEGKIAFVSSDHSSWPVDNKYTPTIFEAGAGIPGLETLLPSYYTDLAVRYDDAIERVASDLCASPAAFFGLAEKGAIAVGRDADLVVLEIAPTPFSAKRNHDGLEWSPYDGETFGARVAATFLRGKPVWDGDAVLGLPGDGRFVPRSGPGSSSLF